MNIKETINEIEMLSNLLKESYVFDESEPEIDSEAAYEDEVIPQEESCGASDKINQIRSMALSGIQDFAENVESEEYQFFKKVWLLCDKFCESDKSSSENVD
ncbi:MAG: hypothetical protein IKT40_12220 [Bacilli bacterium]|nr:hypothetical protein [Bacilli bacterium]